MDISAVAMHLKVDSWTICEGSRHHWQDNKDLLEELAQMVSKVLVITHHTELLWKVLFKGEVKLTGLNPKSPETEIPQFAPVKNSRSL